MGAFPSRGFFLEVPRGSDRYDHHVAHGCPYCVAPRYVQEQGWPSPCRARVSDFVECGTTAAVELDHRAHHWDCPYWDHVETTPFD